MKMECEIFGGTWSPSPCDQNLYTRKCVKEAEYSYAGGPWETVHEVYYYEAGSTTECGDEETFL